MKAFFPGTRTDDASVVVPLAERRAARGANYARLEELFRQYEARLLRFLMIRLGSEADARDALQIVFTRLLAQPERLHDGNLASLLYVCARNVALDELKRRRRCDTHLALGAEGADTASVADQDPGPERRVQGGQQLTLLLSLLDELPPKCRAAFVSYQIEELEYREIAARMGITESMVRKYVIKAVAHCAARFEELEGWE